MRWAPASPGPAVVSVLAAVGAVALYVQTERPGRSRDRRGRLMLLATIVDWAALRQVVVSSSVVSVAVTTLLTSGLVLVEPGDRRPSGARRAVGALLLLASFALVAGGLYVVFTTK